MKKFLTIASLLTIIATPALAQGVSSGYGTGNSSPFAYGSDGKAHQVITPNDQQQFGTKPLYNVVPGGQQTRHRGQVDNGPDAETK
jgi:hypothetical protein